MPKSFPVSKFLRLCNFAIPRRPQLGKFKSTSCGSANGWARKARSLKRNPFGGRCCLHGWHLLPLRNQFALVRPLSTRIVAEAQQRKLIPPVKEKELRRSFETLLVRLSFESKYDERRADAETRCRVKSLQGFGDFAWLAQGSRSAAQQPKSAHKN